MLQSHVASRGLAARLRGDNEPPGRSASVTWHATKPSGQNFKGCIVLPKTGDCQTAGTAETAAAATSFWRHALNKNGASRAAYLPCTFAQISCSIRTCGFIHRVLGQEAIPTSQMQNPLDLSWFPHRASLIARPKKKHLKGPKPAVAVSACGDVSSKMPKHIETLNLGVCSWNIQVLRCFVFADCLQCYTRQVAISNFQTQCSRGT